MEIQIKNNKNVMIALVSGGMALLLLGVAYAGYNKKKNDNSDTTNDMSLNTNTNDTNINNDKDESQNKEKTFKDIIGNYLLENTKKGLSKGILFIGDSQVNGTIGGMGMPIFKSTFGIDANRWGKDGTTPSKIMGLKTNDPSKFNDLKSKLQSKHSIVFIQLGDNLVSNSSSVVSLMDFIMSMYTSNAKPLVIWSGAFPVCIPSSGSESYVHKTPRNSSDVRYLPNYNDEKRKTNTTILSGLSKYENNVIFFDPFVFYKDNDVFSPNTPFTRDGIHLLENTAKNYLIELLKTELN